MRERQRAGGCGQTITASAPGRGRREGDKFEPIAPGGKRRARSMAATSPVFTIKLKKFAICGTMTSETERG